MEALSNRSRSRGLIFVSAASAIGLAIAGLFVSPLPAVEALAAPARAGLLAEATSRVGAVAAAPARYGPAAVGVARAASPAATALASAASAADALSKDRAGTRPKKPSRDKPMASSSGGGKA